MAEYECFGSNALRLSPTAGVIFGGQPVRVSSAATSPLPLVTWMSVDESATSRPAVSADHLAAAFYGGNLDFEVTFTAGIDMPTQVTSNPYLFYFSTPDGECSVRLNYVFIGGESNEPYFTLTVRGSAVGNMVGNNLPPAPMGWRAGDVVTLRAWYRLGLNAGMRLTVNGATGQDAILTASGGALNAATSGYLGSNGTGADLNATFIRAQSYQNNPPTGGWPDTPEFVVLGDSTVTAYYGLISACAAVYDVAQGFYRQGIGNLAVVGDTTSGQLSKFQGSPWWGDTHVRAIILQTGINDVGTSAQIIANYQSAVSAIKLGNPRAKLFISKCIPWGGTQTVIDLCTAIAGGGSTPITGADGAITSHYTTLGGGTDSLQAQYVANGLGNHENNAGRLVVAAAHQSALHSAGLI